MRWRKYEKSKFQSKVEHIRRLRKEEEIRQLQQCPQEIEEFKELIIFDKEKFDRLVKEDVKVIRIGEVELDDDEVSVMKLPPKFAVRKKLNRAEMQTEMQMGMAKTRYQIHKEELVRGIDESDEINENKVMKKRKLLSAEEISEMEEIDKLEAEGRRIFNPIDRCFNYGNKRVTDLKENNKVMLPRPCDPYTESGIELLKTSIMKSFD